MLNNRIVAIVKRELREKLMSKSFILMTLLVPLFMLLIIGLQMLFALYQGDKGTRIELITESESLTESCKKYLTKQDFVKEGTYVVRYDTVPRKSLKSHIEDRKKEILSGKLVGIVFVPSTALKNKEIEFYSKTPTNLTIFEKLDNHLNEVLIDQYFSKKDLTDEELKFARMGVRFNGYKVSEKDELEEEGFQMRLRMRKSNRSTTLSPHANLKACSQPPGSLQKGLSRGKRAGGPIFDRIIQRPMTGGSKGVFF